jgi:hypothetical protein
MEFQVGCNTMESNNWRNKQIVIEAFTDDYDNEDEYHTCIQSNTSVQPITLS